MLPDELADPVGAAEEEELEVGAGFSTELCGGFFFAKPVMIFPWQIASCMEI